MSPRILAGPLLVKIEIAHWYGTFFLLGVVWLFFAWNPIIAVAAIVVAYFLEILIDNTLARVKWQTHDPECLDHIASISG